MSQPEPQEPKTVADQGRVHLAWADGLERSIFAGEASVPIGKPGVNQTDLAGLLALVVPGMTRLAVLAETAVEILDRLDTLADQAGTPVKAPPPRTGADTSGPFRQGRRRGRNIYWQSGDQPDDADQYVGTVESDELAALICAAVNALPPEAWDAVTA